MFQMDTDENLVLRPMKCGLNFLSKSDGSAILAQGETVAVVSVNGPLDVKVQNANIEKSFLEVTYNPKCGKPSVDDRYRENIIRQTCELALLTALHPRTAITISIQELEDFGGLMACCLNAVCLALLNSGLAMRYLFAAVNCAVDDSSNIVVDPSRLTQKNASATMTFIFESENGALLTCFTQGKYSNTVYKEAFAKSKAASANIFQFYRDIVKKYSSTL